MPRKVTSRDVAKRAGVSQTTVSYVMSGRRTVAPETEKRVLDAMKELGYQPHSGARALKSQKTHVIGLVVPYRHGADAAAQHRFLTAITSRVREFSYDILLVTTDEGSAGLRRVINTALCDGLLIMEVLSGDPRVNLIMDSQIPTVFVGIPGNNANVTSVDASYEEAAIGAIERIAAQGFQRVFLVESNDPSLYRLNFLDRFRHSAKHQATVQGIELIHLPSTPSLQTINETINSLPSLVGSAFVLAPLVDTDNWCNALSQHGYKLGHDIALIACSWDEEHSHTLARPAHFDMQMDSLVSTAVELIMKQLEHGQDKHGSTTLIPPIFIPGDTFIFDRYSTH